MNLPEEFQEKMGQLLQEDYRNYTASFSTDYGQTFRINPLKAEPADFIRRFLLPKEGEDTASFARVSWCEEGYYYQGKVRLSAHPFYYGGVYYLQEPSAMAPASFLPVLPGERILDLCAAPGGKTTALAGKLHGKGVLISNDISASRCKALLKNVEMAGVKNAFITCEAPERLAEQFSGYFDKVLIDAPCSGEGMFRRDSSMAKSWSPSEVERYHQLQKEILLRGASMVKPGGFLLYSTCTYSPEEDEQTVETLLDANGDFSLVPLPLFDGVEEGRPEWSKSKNPNLRHCRRFWNHKVAGEGQFAALFYRREHTDGVTMHQKDSNYAEGAASFGRIDQKTGEKNDWINEEINAFSVVIGKEPPEKKLEKKSKKKSRKKGAQSANAKTKKEPAQSGMPEEMGAFFKQCSWTFSPDRLLFLEERVFLLPENAPNLKGVRVIRSGLYLGDCKKKRFEPSQALAMALRPEEYANVLSLSVEDERVEKYLRCETISAEAEDGWVLVCVDGYPLGWGKCSKQLIKNKYYAGWRKR